MQDKAIAAIGRWQLEINKDLEPVDLYIENMFPGKDWQMLLLIFEITETNEELSCNYKGIDIEKVSADDEGYRKYAYRKGSARGGDVTFTTKLGFPVDKKIKTIKETTFNNLFILKKDFPEDAGIFEAIKKSFIENEEKIKNELGMLFEDFERNQAVTTGLSFKILIKGEEKYLRDFDIIKQVISEKGQSAKYERKSPKAISKATDKICSINNKKANDIYGFAAPFSFSTPDKPGFISGYFDIRKNWRNYPISSENTLVLELGKRFIEENLQGSFYQHRYLIIPNPVINTDNKHLRKIINLLHTALQEEKVIRERKKKAEDHIQKIIAEEKNYFNLDLLFFETHNAAFRIKLMLEEILPSRFRKLFIEAPEKVNSNQIFKNAITIKKEKQNLVFSFQIIRDFFDREFLDVVNKLFLVQPLDKEFVFEHIMALIRKKYNEDKTKDGFVEPVHWLVLKAIMLLHYLQELEIITNNKNYKYMETENSQKQTTFNLERFNEFVEENKAFLDNDIKVGIFAVGVLVRFLFDIQQANLNNTPFENKLRGYKLNPELLMNVYTDALDKIQKYQNFYTYQELRDIISKYFVVKSGELTKMSNNELSFYFVAGLELGKEFKREKDNQE